MAEPGPNDCQPTARLICLACDSTNIKMIGSKIIEVGDGPQPFAGENAMCIECGATGLVYLREGEA